MAHGISSFLGNGWMNALGNASAFVVVQPYVKLHVGDPGAAGTSNPAVETTRKSVSFAAAAAGALASDADISWTNIAGSEDATHFTVWDALVAGNFLFSGTITANPYTDGDTYTISSGNLTVSLTLAS
ncbi:hypothetical protein UFOVP943_50 [uncultured Caudovirales phage]|uniref:Uncharacterized protein n=1 Tax=uncultured Caudovirales phage TaxID=2100421 RepID=A0A6J5QIU3_9CAUD|nr:hypothetical protein UFOVP943_50 [uncultured Caudovirales phage]CAB4184263.1 hypothetical protein UFOVP1111_45 [uncultured Caudovirales phage]CAB4203397.1 hypothetical protein UFOVP1380_50 [uncultured Caudovirales phage]